MPASKVKRQAVKRYDQHIALHGCIMRFANLVGASVTLCAMHFGVASLELHIQWVSCRQSYSKNYGPSHKASSLLCRADAT